MDYNFELGKVGKYFKIKADKSNPICPSNVYRIVTFGFDEKDGDFYSCWTNSGSTVPYSVFEYLRAFAASNCIFVTYQYVKYKLNNSLSLVII